MSDHCADVSNMIADLFGKHPTPWHKRGCRIYDRKGSRIADANFNVIDNIVHLANSYAAGQPRDAAYRRLREAVVTYRHKTLLLEITDSDEWRELMDTLADIERLGGKEKDGVSATEGAIASLKTPLPEVNCSCPYEELENFPREGELGGE